MATSDIVRGASKQANIWKKIDEAVQAKGGTADALGILDLDRGSRIIADLADALVQAEREEAGGGYFVTVDYGKLLAQAIAECGCGYNNPNITNENFQCDLSGVADIEIILHDFGRGIGSDEVVEEFNRMDFPLRPANLWELLAFGAKYPQLQTQNPIVALGSVWSRSGGQRFVPCLAYWHSKRRLLLADWQGEWPRLYRFAAVRKVPKVTFVPWTICV